MSKLYAVSMCVEVYVEAEDDCAATVIGIERLRPLISEDLSIGFSHTEVSELGAMVLPPVGFDAEALLSRNRAGQKPSHLA